MSSLAAQQQALLQALWAPSPAQALEAVAAHVQDGRALERGLRAYRSNGRELAVRALAAAYPLVAERLGVENFSGIARQLWLRDPPVRGDIAEWGEGLPELLESIPELMADEPDLSATARLEWLLHRCAVAEDAEQDAGSLALLQARAPEHLLLRLPPGTAVSAAAVVWRDGLRPRSRDLVPGEGPFVSALMRGQSLADALEATPEFDFNAWLAQAWASRLLLGVALAETPGGST